MFSLQRSQLKRGALLPPPADEVFRRDQMHDNSRGDMIPHIVLREIREFPISPLQEQQPDLSADPSGEDEVMRGRSLIHELTLAYGLKLRVTDQDRWIPQSAVIVQAFTPTGGEETATQFITTAVAGWTLPNRWKIDTAMRYGTESEEGDHFNQCAPSAVVKVPFGEKWAAHAEYFGIFTTGKEANSTKHYFSPGLHFLVTPDLEVGFRLGWGLNDQTTRFFSNVGFGWRY
jgi:hypothetical protein